MSPAPLRIPPSRPILLSAEPQLFVADIGAACNYFTSKLGFEVAFTYGEPPFYAQVARDDLRINLRHVDGPVFDPGFRQREKDALSVMITVNDIHGLYDEFRDTGAVFHQNLERQAWGSDVFIIRDLDGNLLGFAG
jgi:uncharacterized glyoxalase superfamily protein PhnB